MKRKLIILLALTVATVGITACGKTETTETEPTEVVEATEVVTEDTETELVEETESDTESLAEESSISFSSTKSDAEILAELQSSIDAAYDYDIVEQGDYPDNRSDHQANWDTFCKYYTESAYGTTFKGLTHNELPYIGYTGYDSSLLEERTTDKGFTVMYDTSTGKVYYSGMTLPTGFGFIDDNSDTVICGYILENDLNSGYDVTYAEMQELLGTYNGD